MHIFLELLRIEFRVLYISNVGSLVLLRFAYVECHDESIGLRSFGIVSGKNI